MSAEDILATTLAGVRFKNPVWIGSSEFTMSAPGLEAAVRSGAGAVVAKSVNESPAASRQLDIADYAFLDETWSRVTLADAPADAALLNRSGLVQHPRDEWLSMLGDARQIADREGTVLIGSLTLGEISAARDIVRELSSVTGHVEVNVGAPHAREAGSSALTALSSSDHVTELVRSVRDVCDGLLLLKLPDAGVLGPAMVQAAQSAGADVVVINGRQNGFMPDIETYQPVLGSWGAYSSPHTLPMSLYAVSKAFRQTRGELPLVGTNGARDAADVLRFLLSGARAVEMVTALWLRGPEYIAQVVAELGALIVRGPVADVDNLIGRSVDVAREYGEVEALAPRAEPWTRWFS